MDTTDMIDLGREYEPCAPCCSSESKDKPEKRISYPSLYLNSLEEIPDMPKGDFYIMARVCVSSIRIDKKNEDNCLELDVKAMKVVGEAEDEEESDDVIEMKDLLEGGSAARLAKKMESYDEGEE